MINENFVSTFSLFGRKLVGRKVIRSNGKGDIGLLKSQNRLNVTMSRGKFLKSLFAITISSKWLMRKTHFRN